jgi:hypothetical protein
MLSIYRDYLRLSESFEPTTLPTLESPQPFTGGSRFGLWAGWGLGLVAKPIGHGQIRRCGR